MIEQANKATVLQGTVRSTFGIYSSKLAMTRCNEAPYYADATALRPYVLCHGPSVTHCEK